MVEIRRILCPIDFSPFSVEAYACAQSLASHYGATLHVQHLVELWNDGSKTAPPMNLFDEYRRASIQEGEERLERFVEAHPYDGVRPEPYVQEGVPADRILALAEELAVDLVVMGTHGRRGLNRLMLGSVTERVLRNAPCLVLVAGNASGDSAPPGKAGDAVPFRRILCCTDFSDTSEKAVAQALSLAEAYGAEMTLVHVLDESPDAAGIQVRIAGATQQLEQLVSSVSRKKGTVSIAVRVGRPYAQIIQAATDINADLTVMGVRGRNALDVAVFGSTTYRVIQLGSCPVLVVPS
ncbi:MAG: universal stress protein [FCB group bacterium]|jgi:nucleotide-binding universal stress UspA family protein|nr:universal stress protein [FCB group bacterium]